MNFMKRVQNSPAMKSVRKKIAENDRKKRALSREYKSKLKSEAKRLAKKKPRTSKRKTTKRRR